METGIKRGNLTRLVVILLFVLIPLFTVVGQSMNLIRFNHTATYTSGSGVSVIMNPTGIFELKNQFVLELSGNGGNWTSQVILNTLDEFYAPVINGVLPVGITAGTYKLRVVSTFPADTIETDIFTVKTAVAIPLPNFSSNLDNQSNSEFTCLNACSNPSANIFGKLDVQVGDKTDNINEYGRECNICGVSGVTYSVKMIDMNDSVISIIPVTGNKFILPNALKIGTYVFELEANDGISSSVISNVFIFHGNATNLNNISSETVCIGNNVQFSIDGTLNGIGRNYMGSKYKVDFGDGTSKEYTQSELLDIFKTNNYISHTYNSVSCSTGNGVNQGYYIVSMKLYNKGIFNTGKNADYCSTYYTNGNGVEKRVNTSMPPVANFTLNKIQCITTEINAVNSTSPGSFGTVSCTQTVKYIWYYKRPTGSVYTSIAPNSPWITNGNLIIPVSEINEPGCWFIKLQAQNYGGGCTQTTEKIDTVSIEMTPVPTFTISTASTICVGTSIQFTNTSNVIGKACQYPVYTWVVTSNEYPVDSGFQYQNSTKKSLKPTILFTKPGIYAVALTIMNSCGSVTSDPTVIRVNGDPTITASDTIISLCSTDPAQAVLDFSTASEKPIYSPAPYAPSSYAWTISGTGIIPSDYSMDDPTVAFPRITFKAFKTYTVSVKVNGNCDGTNELVYKVTLHKTPVVKSSALPQIICSGTSSMPLELKSDMDSTMFIWKVEKTSNITNVANVHLTDSSRNVIPAIIPVNTSTTRGTITYTITPVNKGCSGITFDYVLTVIPVARVIQPASQAVCNGSNTVAINFNTLNAVATTYSWTNRIPSIGLAGSGTGNIPSFTAINTTNAPIKDTLTVIPSIQQGEVTCSGNPLTFVLTVNPTPTVEAVTNQEICNGFSTNAINFTGNNNSTLYKWVNTQPSIGIAANGIGSIPSTVMVNNGVLPVTALFTVTPELNGCTGVSYTFNIIVNPTPVIGNQPLHDSVCVNGTTNPLTVTVTRVTGRAHYQWYSNPLNDTITGIQIDGDTLASFTPSAYAVGITFYYCKISFSGSGCADLISRTAKVTIHELLTITTQPLPPIKICVGGTVTAFTVEFSGGVGAPGYKWFSNTVPSTTGGLEIPGATQASYTPPVFNDVGNYYYYAELSINGSSCGSVFSNPSEVMVIADPVVSLMSPPIQTLCENSTPANLIVSATGGQGSYSYQWYSNTLASNAGGNIIPGEKGSIYTPSTQHKGIMYFYCLVSQEGLGCSATSDFSTVKVVLQPKINALPVTSSVCLNGVPEQLNAGYQNGTGNPSYTWYSNTLDDTSNGIKISGDTTATFNPPSSVVGTMYYYCKILLSQGGCAEMTSNTASVTINKLPLITVQPEATQKICVGGIIKAFKVEYTDGVGIPTYQWYSNTSNSTIGGSLMSEGSSASYTPPVFNAVGNYYYYAVLILDGNGCFPVYSEPAEVTVIADPVITTQPHINQTKCLNATPIDLMVEATGGQGSFSYQWYSNTTASNAGGSIISGEKGSIYTPSTQHEGILYYYCLVSQDGLGCSVTSDFSTVKIVLQPEINAQPEISPVCLNGVPELLKVSYQNGSGNPSYTWYSNTVDDTSTGIEILGDTTASYNPPASVVGTMYYYCKILLSQGGCTEMTSGTTKVTIYKLPSITIQPKPTQNICVGGIVDAFTVGYTDGVGDPRYKWYSNTVNSTIGGSLISEGSSASYTPPVFNAVGKYYFYAELILSGNGCFPVYSEPAEVTVIADPVITSQPVVSQIQCLAAPPIDLIVAASGGQGLYTYQWYSNTTASNSGGDSIPGEMDSIFTPSTLQAGKMFYYCVVSQEGLGCRIESNVSAVMVVPQPEMDIQPVSQTVCLKEIPTLVHVTSKNGTGIIGYQWYSNTVDDSSTGMPVKDAVTANFQPPYSVAGIRYYYCAITFSDGGCRSLVSVAAAITINQYPVIASVDTIIASGTPFTFIPVNSQTDTVPTGTTYSWTAPTINPVNSITGTSAQSSGQTTISQTLTNRTTTLSTVTYTVTPRSGSCDGVPFNITVTVRPPISANETITVIPCFGLHNGSIETNIQGGLPPYHIAWEGPDNFTSGSPSITGLFPGVYILTITGTGDLPFRMNYSITEPDEISIHPIIPQQVSCFGAADGVITMSVSGGTLPYRYTWEKDGMSYMGEDVIRNLSPGNYSVSVTDVNNCGPKTTAYSITQPSEIVISLVSKVNLLCFGDTVGSVTIGVTGGVPVDISTGRSAYTFLWTGPNGFSSNSQNLSGLAAGNYALFLSDATGCPQTFTVTITQPDDVTVVITASPVTCYGENDASVKLDISGGVAPYKIVWSNLGKGVLQSDLSPGTYTVTVIDANDCQKSTDIIIREAEFSILPTIKQISCFGARDGSINLNIHGGKAPISLTWEDNPTAGVTRNRLGAGTYTVTLSDASSCSFTRNFTIIDPVELKVAGAVTQAFDCSNPNSGAINLTINGGTQPYTIQWSNGKTTKDLSSIQSGIYVVHVTDSNGCSISEKFEVIRPLPLILSVKTIQNFDCVNKVVNEISTAQISGGVPPYQITWSGGVVSGLNNETMNTSQSGIYILGVTDGKGCTADYSFDILVPGAGIDYKLIDCDAKNFGFNCLIPVGLASDYTFLWSFGDGQTGIIRHPEHAYTAAGSYKVSLTLTGTDCTSVFEKIITVESSPALVLDKLPVFCTGDSLVLHVTGAGSYRWYNGSTADSIVISQSGDYSVSGTSDAGCTATLNFKATNFDSFHFTIQSDKNEITTVDPTVSLWSESITFSDYFWDFGDDTSSEGNNQTHSYRQLKDGYYEVKLKVKNPNGCYEFASKRIWTTNTSTGNVFTPNGDGIDDVFMAGWNIQVFNRNGILVFDGKQGWDGTFKGKPVSNDTYFYVLNISGESGIKSRTGFITVIR